MQPVDPDIEVQKVSRKDLQVIRDLALRIFPVTYMHIVEAEQIDYMMDLFYTTEALISQHDSGQVFLIINYGGISAGYASYTPLTKAGYFKLNKIYVDTNLQGKGLGRILLTDVIFRVTASGGKNLQLNVNRHNKAVGFYKSMGFSVLMEELLDIGNGYYMDDYVMAITIKEKDVSM